MRFLPTHTRPTAICPSILLSNIQSLRPKYDELCIISASLAPQLIILCESWLSDQITDQEILLPLYSTHRCDRRDGRRGGGVCVYASCSIRCEEITVKIPLPRCIEGMWLRLFDSNIILMALYVPPSLTSAEYKEIEDHLVEGFDEISSSLNDPYLIIAGDLNQLPTDQIEAQLNLTQIVDSPTRGDALLDKILLDSNLLRQYSASSVPDSHHSSYGPLTLVGPGIGNSDHRSVFMKSLAFTDKTSQVCKVYDYRTSHMNSFKARLATYPWSDFYKANLSLDEKCDLFHKIIDDAKSAFPFSYVTLTNKDKPWITPVLKNLINLRYEAFRCKNFQLYHHYKQKVKSEIIKAKKNWTSSKLNNAKGLWSIVKSTNNRDNEQTLTSLLSGFPSINDAAERISKKFCESFSAPPNWLNILASIPNNEESWTPNINCMSVTRALLKLKPQKAAGSDHLPPRLLRDAAFEITAPLTHLLALSIEASTVPLKWKIAKVIPVPKKANPTIEHLRPLSMLPLFSKVLEHLALAPVKEKVISMYGPNQFGFRPKYSTIHAHIKAHDYITRLLDSKQVKAVIIISFDMRKAFDSLNHEQLMDSLVKGNLPSKFLHWIASFLQSRSQFVSIKEAYSTIKPVTSGVPQGSVIAPFLFAAHMGSLTPYYPDSVMTKFADDIVTVTPVHSLPEASKIAKKEINCVDSWCKSHGLQLNKQKTKVMMCSNTNIQTSQLQDLELFSEIKILGVTFSKNMKWDCHIRTVCRKASQRIFVLKRLKEFLPHCHMIRIYKALILSILEYNAPVMVGMSTKNKDCLERVRRRCHRVICGSDCDCDQFSPLHTRRSQQAINLFKTISADPTHLLHYLIPQRLPRTQQFSLDHTRTNKRLQSFIPFCSILANRLRL